MMAGELRTTDSFMPYLSSEGLEGEKYVRCLFSFDVQHIAFPAFPLFLLWAAKTQPANVALWKTKLGLCRKTTARASPDQGCT